MRDAGLIPKDLSKRSGKRYATVVELLNGKIANPQLDTIEAVCEALGFRLSFELRPDSRKKPGRPARKGRANDENKSPGE